LGGRENVLFAKVYIELDRVTKYNGVFGLRETLISFFPSGFLLVVTVGPKAHHSSFDDDQLM